MGLACFASSIHLLRVPCYFDSELPKRDCQFPLLSHSRWQTDQTFKIETTKYRRPKPSTIAVTIAVRNVKLSIDKISRPTGQTSNRQLTRPDQPNHQTSNRRPTRPYRPTDRSVFLRLAESIDPAGSGAGLGSDGHLGLIVPDIKIRVEGLQGADRCGSELYVFKVRVCCLCMGNADKINGRESDSVATPPYWDGWIVNSFVRDEILGWCLSRPLQLP